MDELTRRAFIRRLAAAGLGAWATAALGGCQEKAAETPLATSPTPEFSSGSVTATRSPSTASPTAPSPTTQAAMGGLPRLVVARGGEPDALVRQALRALGGIEQFVHAGDDVIVKPNICVGYHGYEYAATTNPWVVSTLVRMCLEAGARQVRVMDQPFASLPEDAYRISGIREQVEAAGGRMEIMTAFKFSEFAVPAGRDIKKWAFYEDALKADVIINVPIAKHHGIARLTLGMKNLMGLIRNRSAMHLNLGQRIADITSVLTPTLTLIDAVRILMDNGPTGGNLNDVKKLDTVIVSPDIVAADSYASTLFGLQPLDLDYIRAGTEMGLGRSDLDNLAIEEIAVGL